MTVRRLTTRAALLLLTFLIFSSGVLPQHRHSESSAILQPERFCQSIALSDFDADGFLDEARVEGSSYRKSVNIRLSGSGKRSFLHFRGEHALHGSLFAQDLDNDGATDLIWADPLSANDALVWLGDGSGRFVQVDSGAYAREFALGTTGVTEPDQSNQETAINFETNRSLDQALSPKYLGRSAIALPNEHANPGAVSSSALGQPTGRAPPFLLS
jgi:hypothetical protein